MPRRFLLPALLSVLALLGGMQIAGSRSQETPLGEISFRLLPHPSGAGEFYVPLADWGIRIDLFDAPILLHAEPRVIDRENLLLLSQAQADILEKSREALQQGLLLLLLQNIVAVLLLALILALLAASLLQTERKQLLLRTGGTTLGLVFALLAVGWSSYSPEKLQEPTFYEGM